MDVEIYNMNGKHIKTLHNVQVHGQWGYAQQSVQPTALRRGLALSLLFNVVLLAVVLFTIGGM